MCVFLGTPYLCQYELKNLFILTLWNNLFHVLPCVLFVTWITLYMPVWAVKFSWSHVMKQKIPHLFLNKFFFHNFSHPFSQDRSLKEADVDFTHILIRNIFFKWVTIRLFQLFSFWSWSENVWNIKIHSALLWNISRTEKKLPSFKKILVMKIILSYGTKNRLWAACLRRLP